MQEQCQPDTRTLVGVRSVSRVAVGAPISSSARRAGLAPEPLLV
jgi:hypothetical protein